MAARKYGRGPDQAGARPGERATGGGHQIAPAARKSEAELIDLLRRKAQGYLHLPNVTSVGLGNVNGVTLGYQSGTGQGEAKAAKDDKTYTITGTATGIDMANPMQPVNKPFEIAVTCP